MTVAELIKELKKANQDSQVIVADRHPKEVTGVDLSHMNVANRYVFLDLK